MGRGDVTRARGLLFKAGHARKPPCHPPASASELGGGEGCKS